MTIYYLYVKTHKVTGLKYLGYTGKTDPYAYTGSGTRWLSHLAKHGSMFDTEILHECETKQQIKDFGIYYSNLWNVVFDREWANLKEESGDGGGCVGEQNGMFGKTHTAEVKNKLANLAGSRFHGKSYEELYGIQKANELKHQRAESLKGVDHSGNKNPMYERVHKETSKALQSMKAKNRPHFTCIYCNKTMASSQFSRWHGDKCSKK